MISGKLETDIASIRDEKSLLGEECTTLERQVKLLSESEEVLLSDLSYYERSYEFDDIDKYSRRLETIRRNRKDLVKMDMREAGAAVYGTADYHSIGEQRQISRLMLRAFNGECDGFIARVSYKNIVLMKQRIINSHAAINKITFKQFRLKISMKYKDTWVDELCLVYE